MSPRRQANAIHKLQSKMVKPGEGQDHVKDALTASLFLHLLVQVSLQT